MRSADSRLKHAAAPNRNAAFLCYVMHGDRFTEAAYTPYLDIDNPTRLHIDRCKGIAAISNRFIQADCSLNPLLKHRMKVKVVIPKRLLSHQQLELIPRRNMVEVLHPVRRIRIAA